MIRTKYNVFGKGLKLQIAIVISCQCAFVLFGYGGCSSKRALNHRS